MSPSNKKEKMDEDVKFILKLGNKLAKDEILSTESRTNQQRINQFKKEIEKALDKIEKKSVKNED